LKEAEVEPLAILLSKAFRTLITRC